MENVLTLAVPLSSPRYTSLIRAEPPPLAANRLKGTRGVTAKVGALGTTFCTLGSLYGYGIVYTASHVHDRPSGIYLAVLFCTCAKETPETRTFKAVSRMPLKRLFLAMAGALRVFVDKPCKPAQRGATARNKVPR